MLVPTCACLPCLYPGRVDMTLRPKACHHTVFVLDAQMSQTPHSFANWKDVRHERKTCIFFVTSEVGQEQRNFPDSWLWEVSTRRAPHALTSRCMSELKTSLVLFPFDPAAWWLKMTSAWFWGQAMTREDKRTESKVARQNRPHYYSTTWYDITSPQISELKASGCFEVEGGSFHVQCICLAKQCHGQLMTIITSKTAKTAGLAVSEHVSWPLGPSGAMVVGKTTWSKETEEVTDSQLPLLG